MAPNSTIHLVRHAEGYHQLPRDHPDVNIRDPDLTLYGIAQSKHFEEVFPYHSQINLLCASPLRRTLQTTSIAFNPEIRRGLKIVAIPDAQEATDAPSDTGSDVKQLVQQFGDILDLGQITPDWYSKTGKNAVDIPCLKERAKRLRIWLRNRSEENIVVVTHGYFAHFLTGHIDREGNQTGEYWTNVMWRTFGFSESDDSDSEATFLEHDASRLRLDREY